MHKKQIRWDKIENPFGKSNDKEEDEYISEHENMVDSYEQKEADDVKAAFMFPVSDFNLYEISTNFWITPEVSKTIEFTDGVEVFKVLTPYRALVAVGKLFSAEDTEKKVRDKINSLFYGKKKIECSSSKKNENPD